MSESYIKIFEDKRSGPGFSHQQQQKLKVSLMFRAGEWHSYVAPLLKHLRPCCARCGHILHDQVVRWRDGRWLI